MISVYTGFPGSGKSLHAVSLIYAHVKGKAMVYTNIDLAGFGNNPYFEYHDFTWFEKVENVKNCASAHFHDKVKTLFVIDEAQVLFDSRNWNTYGRKEWNIFFSMHRHYKCDIVLVTQSFQNLDKRIRANIEFQCQHVNIKNATKLSHMFLQFFPDFMFLSNKFYANTKELLCSSWIFARKKYIKLYNTYDRVGLSVPENVLESTQGSGTDSADQQHDV